MFSIHFICIYVLHLSFLGPSVKTGLRFYLNLYLEYVIYMDSEEHFLSSIKKKNAWREPMTFGKFYVTHVLSCRYLCI